MKYLSTILLLLTLFSCKKETVSHIDKQSFRTATEATISETSPTYNLYPIESEGGYETLDASGRIGLWHEAKQVRFATVSTFLYNETGGKFPVGQTVKLLNIGCPVGNGIPGDSWDTTLNNPITRSGLRDLVVNNDGSESIPIQLTVYANGEVFSNRKKQEFDYAPTGRRIGAPDGIKYNGKDYVWWGHYDLYYNDNIIPFEPVKCVLAVTLDYANSNPYTALFPFYVDGTTVVLDTTAIAANAAHPATNYKAVIQRGRNKGVLISWEGNSYAYCIEKWNGSEWVMILRWYDGKSFLDVNGTMKDKYRIVSRAQGRIPDARTDEFGVSKK